ncbi:hypothetical protein Enr10x_33530 [Gimesia panareensis]|uniref:Uncharacterized protein n=1 Tax=Gimesia panareensis TaxID=2527978 RepID=A0A517Q8R1_9PLAN|nr:hypothetical protein Enr10x_33530 [Gimesia panareensis]
MSQYKESRTVRALCYLVPVLLMAYILSIGPVVVSVEDSKGNLPAQYHGPLRSVYAPIVWVIDRNHYCRKVYAEYHQLCSPHY